MEALGALRGKCVIVTDPQDAAASVGDTATAARHQQQQQQQQQQYGPPRLYPESFVDAQGSSTSSSSSGKPHPYNVPVFRLPGLQLQLHTSRGWVGFEPVFLSER